MDVDRQSNPPEARTRYHCSSSSNQQFCSQSRKISIGILVDSISMTEPKDIRETVIQIAENGSSSKGNCVKDGKQHPPVVQKHRTALTNTSPWVSTRSFDQKMSSAAPMHNTEHTPNSLAIGRRHPRLKLLEKASAGHSVNFFSGRSGLESDQRREKNCATETHALEIGKINAEHEDNPVCSTEVEIPLEKEHAATRIKETGGRETLRMKLWEVLGNDSSPNKHGSASQPMKLHPDQRDGKQSPIEKNDPNSDTIESDSEKHTLRRPMSRSSTRNRASTKNQNSKVFASKSTYHKKGSPKKKMLPQKEDHAGRFPDSFYDFSLRLKRNKTGKLIPGGQTYPVHNHEKAEERRQSQDKIRSVSPVEKSVVHKVISTNRSDHRISDVAVEPKSGIEKKSSEPPLDLTTGKLKDVEQPMDIPVIKLKDQQQDKHHSFSGNKRNPAYHPLTSSFEMKLRGCLPERNMAKIQTSGEKAFNTRGIRSFKSLMSSIQAEPNMQPESSDHGCKLKYTPPTKPRFIIEDGANGVSKSPTEATDFEDSENDSLMEGCRETKKLSPEISIQNDFQHGSDKSLGHKEDDEVTGCSPGAESLTGTPETSKLQMNERQNDEDGLARAVELFTVALARVKTKLKSVSNKRSSEIMRAAAENILVLLQDAESQIKTDMGKLNNLTEQKRKQLETRFQEQQDQLLGIYKKFKSEVDQHLHDYGDIIEDLEEHEIELKRYVERQRGAHRKSLLQVEQEIKIHLDDAGSRIMDVQELARERMLKLKLVVAESVRNGTFG